MFLVDHTDTNADDGDCEKDVVAATRFASHGAARARTSHIIHTKPQDDPIFYASTHILAARGDIALLTTDTNADGGD